MGSFGVDIDLRFDATDALKKAKDFNVKYKAMLADVAAGVQGAAKKAEKAWDEYSRSMISTSTRAGRQVEASIKSLERQAEMAGKTRSEQLLIRQQKWIKMLGEDEAAIKRVTAAFQQMIKVENEQEKKVSGHGGAGIGNLLYRGTRDIFEGRVTYGVMDYAQAAKMKLAQGGEGGMGGLLGGAAAGGAAAGGGGMLAGISGATIGVVGLSAALVGYAIAGYKAAEASGEYARSVREIQGVTGMTVKEVQTLEIAAKLSGRSTDDYERAMRGLTQALAGGGSAAEKAGRDLQKMGVNAVGLRLGLVSSSEALEQIGEALRKNPDAFESNLQMMEIFKKSGLNLKLLAKEWGEAVVLANKLPLFDEDKFKQMDKMEARWKEVGIEVDRFFKNLKFWLAQEFTADLEFVIKVKDVAGKYIVNPLVEGWKVDVYWLQRAGLLPPDDSGSRAGEFTYPGVESRKAHRIQVTGERSEQFGAFIAGEGMAGLEGAEKKLHQLEKQYSDLTEKNITNEASFVKDPKAYIANVEKVTAELHKQKALVESIRDAESDRKTIAEALRRLNIEAREREEHPYGFLAADQKLKTIMEMRGVTPGDVHRAAVALAPVRLEEVWQNIDRATDIARAAAEKIAQEYGVTPSTKVFNPAADLAAGDAARARELTARLAREDRVAKEELRSLLEMQKEVRQNEEASALRGVRLGGILGVSTVESRLAQESQIRDIREQTARQEAIDARTRLSAEYTTRVEYENSLTAIRLKQEGEIDKAREDYQAKYLEEVRKQLDEIKDKVEPLFDTLFNDPSKFGAQMRQTIKQAALHPIVSGLSELTANALHPLIFGATGTGGIAGTFRGVFGGHKLNDVKLTSDGSVPVHVTGVSGGFGGGGGGGGWTGGGGFGIGGGGGSGPNIGTSIYDLPSRNSGQDLAMASLGAALGIGGGGTADHKSASINPYAATAAKSIEKYFGGSYSGSGGFGRILTNIKQYGAAINNEGGASWAARISALSTGPFAGTKAGPAAGMLGGMLASAGIFGEQRGTVGGAAMAAGGGFLIGGPIGFAIGAGIGLGEILAGVESQRREAKRLAEGLYHISVNSATADQIVSIANQSYGGRVSIAVRSPEVRHMLGLYAAGTGQSSTFQQGMMDAHGASLVESGGSLQQQATYQYGQAYAYRSSLPIYGDTPTHMLGAPGGNNLQLSLNIGGQDAARFMTGQVVTPDVVQTQYASAMNNSTGRVPQALMMSEPGAIAS